MFINHCQVTWFQQQLVSLCYFWVRLGKDAYAIWCKEIVLQGASRSWWGSPQRQLAWACGSSETGLTAGELAWDWLRTSASGWQLCSLICLWGPGPVPDAWAGSLEPILYGGIQGGSAWSCLNMICHALLTTLGGLTPSEWRWRRSG